MSLGAAIGAHLSHAGGPLHVPGAWSGSDLQPLMRRDEELVPAVGCAEAQDDLPAAADDLGGDVHKGLAEALPLPAHDLGGECQQGDPLAEVPGEPGDLKPGAVAVEFGDRHPPCGESGPELVDHVLPAPPL